MTSDTGLDMVISYDLVGDLFIYDFGFDLIIVLGFVLDFVTDHDLA